LVEVLFPSVRGSLELVPSGWPWVFGVDAVGGSPHGYVADECGARVASRWSPGWLTRHAPEIERITRDDRPDHRNQRSRIFFETSLKIKIVPRMAADAASVVTLVWGSVSVCPGTSSASPPVPLGTPSIPATFPERASETQSADYGAARPTSPVAMIAAVAESAPTTRRLDDPKIAKTAIGIKTVYRPVITGNLGDLRVPHDLRDAQCSQRDTRQMSVVSRDRSKGRAP
jgi:hypothetical protein